MPNEKPKLSLEIRTIYEKYSGNAEYFSADVLKDIERLIQEINSLEQAKRYCENANKELTHVVNKDKSRADSPLLLNQSEVSRIIGFSESWLEKKRFEGKGEGPKYTKIGRLVRYHVSDIIEWVNQFHAK